MWASPTRATAEHRDVPKLWDSLHICPERSLVTVVRRAWMAAGSQRGDPARFPPVTGVVDVTVDAETSDVVLVAFCGGVARCVWRVETSAHRDSRRVEQFRQAWIETRQRMCRVCRVVATPRPSFGVIVPDPFRQQHKGAIQSRSKQRWPCHFIRQERSDWPIGRSRRSFLEEQGAQVSPVRRPPTPPTQNFGTKNPED